MAYESSCIEQKGAVATLTIAVHPVIKVMRRPHLSTPIELTKLALARVVSRPYQGETVDKHTHIRANTPTIRFNRRFMIP